MSSSPKIRDFSWLKKKHHQPSKVIYMFFTRMAGLCGKPCDVDGGAPNRQGSPCIVVKVEGWDKSWKTTVFLKGFLEEKEDMKHSKTHPQINIYMKHP